MTFAIRGSVFGAMPTSMQEAVLERPVLGEIIPTIILVSPTKMPELPDEGSGKYLVLSMESRPTPSNGAPTKSACAWPWEPAPPVF